MEPECGERPKGIGLEGLRTGDRKLGIRLDQYLQLLHFLCELEDRDNRANLLWLQQYSNYSE